LICLTVTNRWCNSSFKLLHGTLYNNWKTEQS